MKKRNILLTAALIATTVMTGCKKEETKDTKESKPAVTKKIEKKAGLVDEWDAAAELKHLQGTLKVKDKFGVEPSTWIVKDDNITVIFREDTTKGTLDLSEPCVIKIVEPMKGGGTSSSSIGYARNGKDLYIGLGKCGMKFGKKYVVNEGGLFIYDGKTGKFHEEADFGKEGYKDPVEVKAEIVDNNGKKVLKFETPNRYKKGEFNKFELEVVGSALLNHQAIKNLVKK